jgi:23S rRNA (adenine2503-C2)-methyltransferase
MYQVGMKRKNVLGLDLEEMMELARGLGEKPFRGRQLYRQIYARKVFDFESMTDLAKGFRNRLAENLEIRLPQVWERRQAGDGTVKTLFRLEDGRFVESVFIPEEGRDTLCISSQAGCNVGCSFCMTAKMGLERNLKAGEIVGQVLSAIKEGDLSERGFNIVFMGMGEPLLNYKNVMKSFRLMTDPGGMALSHRKITVSTSGIVPVMKKMSLEESLPNLAVSLNATTDALRDLLMPVNRKWNIEELLRACGEFPLESRRRITFEYILLKDLTDSEEDARRLARLLHGVRAKVNLIPFNPNPGMPYRRPSDERVEHFRRILVDRHVSAFVRKTRGDDIAAACGQLAYLEKEMASS